MTMYKCRSCGAVFEEEEISSSVTRYPYGDTFAEQRFDECPYCDSGDFDESKKCVECDEWFLPEELYEGRCEDCLKKHATFDNVLDYAEEEADDVKGLVESVLSSTEIVNLLISAAREKLKLSSALREKVVEYAMEDKECFGYYIANRIAEGR